jgi:hypothetical protein
MLAELEPSFSLEHSISQAEKFCVELPLLKGLWPGVEWDTSHSEQVAHALKELSHFKTTMQELTQLWWSSFGSLLQNPHYSNNPDLVTFALNATIEPRMKEVIPGDPTTLAKGSDNHWSLDASVEMEAFRNFVTSEPGRETWHTLAEKLRNNPNYAQDVAVRFLEHHVGTGHHRVHEVNQIYDGRVAMNEFAFRREGFDGEGKTCPIARVPDIGVHYFAVAAASYILMNEIFENLHLVTEQ